MPSKTELRRLARRFDLTIVGCSALTIRRRKAGRGFSYTAADGQPIRDPQTLQRLKSLAVPPAYRHVMFAADPRAHLQAVGEDTAGRLQYRYHPDWTRVREAVKAQKLADLAESLPAITRAVQRALKRPEPDRRFALAAAVQLVALTAIRAGSDAYAQEHGTRGATTLLKSHARIEEDRITLRFKGKGGKMIAKETRHPALVEALRRMCDLPGRRLFKYRDAKGAIHTIRASDVNAFLKGIGRSGISLKDFRTLAASMGVLDRLARETPETSAAKRRKQINAAVAPLAEELANTLTVCRTSYVHDTVIAAFEAGKLTTTALRARSATAKAALLAELLGSGARKRIKAATVEASTVRRERPVLGGALPAA
ncbi:DNA topoisomerase IB [Ancylobacter sp. WKF20]|uniref:DNA topoisomerase IB n=1 Tax=Ancylobacter sp. WKF20 TaxID=3039801 RepID=UPI0024344236|nr:DNA topoisomerase IB [Ancylobacter sp. WKF20]WGD30486.1 DNA topoisomerase IB [Ancylobacter sp. WKF20]